MRKEVPLDKRKFRRTKNMPNLEFITEQMTASAEMLTALEATAQNCLEISTIMKQCFSIHKNMITQGKNVHQIYSYFPHLKSYQGLLVQQAFGRLLENPEPEGSLKRILSQALLLQREAFNEVNDVYIRGCLILMKEMAVRGVKRPMETMDLSPEEIYASPLIKWIRIEDATDYLDRENPTAHIICFGSAFQSGHFMIVLGRNCSINMGANALQTLNVFLRLLLCSTLTSLPCLDHCMIFCP
ncbi:uncharacterized protein LOC129723758 isoform X2 [Wyeomyia smithii]|uniref:uncharacterized protein LOC129723758 isoform X2 n=1 Tax=Wyeomyia smithii TaxID=174621 RepID=UPI002467D984|nr:uncharacterized protein LOC129723758 isoform X2 [Wyeomyia smithii]